MRLSYSFFDSSPIPCSIRCTTLSNPLFMTLPNMDQLTLDECTILELFNASRYCDYR